MNFRYCTGATVTRILHALLSARWLPLCRAVPVGWCWAYDVQRFAGTRDLPVLVDAGANIGQTTRLLAKYFPGSAIHSFEPVQATWRKLKLTTSHIPNVRCVQSALGKVPGSMTIALRENSETNTLVSPKEDTAAPNVMNETIELDTLDHYCHGHGIESIDVLKLDVQGYEMEVLKGSSALLAKHRISFVYTEVSFNPDDAEMQDFSALHLFLLGQGFKLCGFYEPFRWGEARRFLGFCNALYICPEALAGK